jgi:magnesium-transporting ATPase (P-type)
VSEVARLQRDGSAVAMVGDGINDAAALAQADVGIAVGAGSHMAVEAADMVLMRNNLFDVIVALDLARCVFARVKWNFLWAFAYNVVAIPFAAGLWFPITHMLVSPQYAGLAMALSSTSVVLSSLALRLYRRPEPHDSEAQNFSEGFERKQQFGIFAFVRSVFGTMRDWMAGRWAKDAYGSYSRVPAEDGNLELL